MANPRMEGPYPLGDLEAQVQELISAFELALNRTVDAKEIVSALISQTIQFSRAGLYDEALLTAVTQDTRWNEIRQGITNLMGEDFKLAILEQAINSQNF